MPTQPGRTPCEFAAWCRAGRTAKRRQCRRVLARGRGLRPQPGACPRPHPRPDCTPRAGPSALGAARIRNRSRRARAGRRGMRDPSCRLRPVPPPLRCAAFDAPPSMLLPIACEGRLVRPIKRMPHACRRTVRVIGPALEHGRGPYGGQSRWRAARDGGDWGGCGGAIAAVRQVAPRPAGRLVDGRRGPTGARGGSRAAMGAALRRPAGRRARVSGPAELGSARQGGAAIRLDRRCRWTGRRAVLAPARRCYGTKSYIQPMRAAVRWLNRIGPTRTRASAMRP